MSFEYNMSWYARVGKKARVGEGRNGVPKLKVANSFDRIMMPSIRDDCLLASYPLR